MPTHSSLSATVTDSETDAELLSRFIKSGDGRAFSKLVERHLNLVFGAACRRTESRELAQEAAQNTFCQLARHAARVRVRESLAPWLHKVAIREAGTLLRSERSRQRTLRRLAVSVAGGERASVQPSGCPDPSSVPRAADHLDDALASLPESERRVILLRYLQGLSLRELASIEASSEEAVRKRVSRALERLAALLARQGVTASAMMGCLTHVPLWPAPPPAGIATRAAKEAASASASAGFAALLVSCMPLVAVFLAAAIPAALPWGAAAPVPGNPPDTTLIPIGAMEPERTPPAGKRLLTPAVMAGLRRELSSMQAKSRHAGRRAVRQRVLDRIGGGDFLETYIDPFRWAAIQSLIADLPVDEIRSLAATLLQETDGHFIAETVFTRWTELAPEEARQAALEHMTGSGDYRPLLGTLRVMARGDFAGVLRWAKASAPEFCRDDILLSLIQPLAAADPRAYVKWSTDPSTSPGKSKVNTVGAPPPSPGGALYGVLPYDTSFALNGLHQGERDGSLKFPVSCLEEDLAFKGQLKPSHAETMGAFARDLPGDSALRGQLLIIAAITLADSQPARAADLLTAARPDSGEPDDRWLGMMGSLLRDWQDRDMPSALDWLAAHPDLNLDPDTLSGLVRRNRLRMPEKTKPSPVVTP